MNARMLVVGVGNRDQGDDGVGPEIVRLLTDRIPPPVALLTSSGDGAALLSAWQDVALAILVDALPNTGHPGRTLRYDAGAQALPADLFAMSSHAFGITHAGELARTLRLLPPALLIYGVEGSQFALGAPLSTEVVAALPNVTAAILAEIGHYDDDSGTA